ncbi:DgyrCDS833 [Dimorphilus gyrociliatus]|uniref:DgyrCDS833 n=1 Tax=Dimorphilus gyrociliatus TaxID=2664684 RepID=A0A7I8V7A8_9ANNE|nr:DgyrCDS833 [Dimorphilus gyrociliatus]
MRTIVILFLAIILQESRGATVPTTNVYNCDAGQTGLRRVTCGMCSSGRIPTKDKLKCLQCPNWCIKGECVEKSSWTNENDATDCKACTEHYYLKGTVCEECSIGCKNCTDATICNACYSNYVLKDTPKECASCPSNCVACNWNTANAAAECSTCKDEYSISYGFSHYKHDAFSACGSYCKSCSYSKDNGVSCSSCYSNAYKETNSAVSTCKLCSTAISGCKRCTNKDTCTECLSKAYSITSSNKCEACSTVSASCIECDASSGVNKCKKCMSGYYLNSGSCSLCPRNCDTCEQRDNIIKCTKCKVDYTIVDVKSCDRCPDNCLQCHVVVDKLTIAMHAPGTRQIPELNVTEMAQVILALKILEEDLGGEKMMEPVFVTCPSNCLKCYFKITSSSTPVCYASKCAKGFGFDDTTGTCFPCQTGCDYCKKASTSSICQKCSEKYAPKFVTGTSNIETCISCSSLSNCDHCEVIGNDVKCRRSPCASKSTGTNKKFSFSSSTCATACPADSSCPSADVHDENEICYCRNCPSGSVTVTAGANAGVCKSCGIDCEECVLSANKEDVECRTCKGSKQWVTVETGSPAAIVRGCYDCSIASPMCKLFEYTGSPAICKCKTGECIGDISHTSPNDRLTVLQSPTNHQECKACHEHVSNALWCGGTYAMPTLATCKFGYMRDCGGTACLKIVPNCAFAFPIPSPVSPSIATCTQCATNAYYDPTTGLCPICNADPTRASCTSCIYDSGNVLCTGCNSPSKKGYKCGTTDCGTSIPNCATPWAMDDSGSTCKCHLCTGPSTETVTPLDANQFFGTGCGAPQSAAIPNCDTQAIVPSPSATDYCQICSTGYTTKAGNAACEDITPFTNTTTPINVPVAVDPGSRSPSGCLGYLAIEGVTASDGRCGACPTGQELEVVSPSQYKCTACTVSGRDNCEFVVAHNGGCRCGRCTADASPNFFIMKPDHSSCLQCTLITDCTTHTLRLANGGYLCACAACGMGRILSADGFHCVDCSSSTCSGGTIAVNSGTTCSCECAAGSFKKADGTGCVPCTAANFANCQTNGFKLNSDNTCGCSGCATGYVMKSDKSACLSCTATTPGGITPNCKTCTESLATAGSIDKCTLCNDHFALKAETAPTAPSCMACETGCKTCTVDTTTTPATTSNKCRVCNPGYALNNAGKCIQCPQTPTICSECLINPADETQTLCLQFGCGSNALRDNDFKCEGCSIANCQKCVKDIGNTFKCLKCNDKHYMDSVGSCQTCVADCDFCIDGTTCLPNGCKEGFIRHRTEGICISCTGSGVSRCIYSNAQSDTLVPKVCKTGYILNIGVTPHVCQKCDSNCKSCPTNGKDKCDSGQCNSGYIYDSTDQKCYPNKFGCLTSTRSNGKTTCQSCNTATSVLSNGECKTCPTGCSGCSFDAATSKFTCSSCKAQYYKTNDNLCSPCPTGCSACSLNGASVECTSCLATYGLKGTSCELCGIGECQTCSASSGGSSLVCMSCSSKFYLSNEDCGQCPKFCKECSYNQKYECTKCYDRYAKASDGTCVPCPSNCEICTANADKTTRCTKCISNSYSLKTDGTCSLCSEAAFANCATCGPTPSGGKSKCDMCSGGFTLQDDKLACVSCLIIGCDMCAHGRVCSKCKSGFYLHNYDRECARKCFECKGNQADCGNDISSTKNSTNKVKVIDCGIGDCWAYRTEVSGTITFARGCSNETCTSSNENENCKTVQGKKECVQCCRGERCNTWALDGKAGVAGLVSSTLLIVLCIVESFAQMSLV